MTKPPIPPSRPVAATPNGASVSLTALESMVIEAKANTIHNPVHLDVTLDTAAATRPGAAAA